MLEEGIRRGRCHDIHQYVKANNKYINYDKNKESSYTTKHWDVNNLHRWAMLRKLFAGGFK